MIGDQERLTILETLNNKSAFQEFYMGDFDEEEKQYIFYDIETKKVYDVRKENDLRKMQD